MLVISFYTQLGSRRMNPAWSPRRQPSLSASIRTQLGHLREAVYTLSCLVRALLVCLHYEPAWSSPWGCLTLSCLVRILLVCLSIRTQLGHLREAVLLLAASWELCLSVSITSQLGHLREAVLLLAASWEFCLYVSPLEPSLVISVRLSYSKLPRENSACLSPCIRTQLGHLREAILAASVRAELVCLHKNPSYSSPWGYPFKFL